MEFKVPQQLLQAVLNYLASKPYAEVTELITAIQALKPIADEPKAE